MSTTILSGLQGWDKAKHDVQGGEFPSKKEQPWKSRLESQLFEMTDVVAKKILQKEPDAKLGSPKHVVLLRADYNRI